VAVIDHRPFGGTCPLRGCDPKTMLISGAEEIDLARRMHKRGVAGELRIDWKELIAFKRTFTDPIPIKREEAFAKQGITAYHGSARFAGPDRVAVDGHVLQGSHILIASGARPVSLRFPGAEHLITSDAFMELEHLPGRIAMVGGGGYIAAEFSHIAARAGAKVVVFQRAERMLTHFDPDLVGWLTDKFREIGIDVRTGNTVTAIEHTGREYRVHTQSPEGEGVIAADLVVHAAGRAPDTAELDLPAANIATKDGRLQLNDFYKASRTRSSMQPGTRQARGRRLPRYRATMPGLSPPIFWRETATGPTIAACQTSPSRCRRSPPSVSPRLRHATKG
jgi:glutathione reductase (NADPH)